jgi:hypothetical protein
MSAKAVSFTVCCGLLGISIRTGQRRLADGTFPVPSLPRLRARSHYKFSSVEIDRYLSEASIADARPRLRRAS